MSRIPQQDQIEFQFPPGGDWFYTQQPVLELYQASGGLVVAWDKPNRSKMYGLYSMSRELFMLNLLDTPVANRHCYELLAENAPCRGYADVEWEGQEDPEHSEIIRLVRAIRDKAHEEYSHEPKIYVCCGTRPKREDPSVLKHSYHIVLENIIFERNNDGQMKQFFTGIPGFTWMDGVEEKSMIDPLVYTKNRVFRLPHCTKTGSTIPLVRISGDPLLDILKHEFGRDVQAVLPFFISNPEVREDCKFINTPPQLLQQAALKTKNAKRARNMDKAEDPSTAADMPILNKLLPVPIQVVQRLLVLAGDNVSTLGSIQYLPQEDQWKIQGDQRAQGRNCLLTAGTTHDSNNALLFVDRVETGFRVHYQCMSVECAKCPKPILGYISMNQQNYEWQIALSSPPPDEMQEDQQPEPDDMMQEDAPETDPLLDDQEMPDDAPAIELVDPPHDPDNPSLNTYEMVKARFEEKCFKVEIPFCYARIKQGHDPCLHSHVDLQHYFCDLTYWGPNKDGDIVKLSFIAAWLKDPTKRTVEKIVVDPTKTMQGVYNMWKGFDAEKLQPILDEDTVQELVLPITKHINEVITLGVEAHTQFIHHYLANILQRPWQKSQVAISLYGAQGCGKGIIFEFFRQKILGTHCSYQTSKPENDLFGRFANGAVNRVCIQIDEVKSLHDHADQLKDFITNPTVNYEKKGKDTIVVSNFANLILTTNNAKALTVSTDDRRFALFHCSSVHKGNTRYFSELGAHLEQPKVARAYYQYLMSLDLREYPTSFQHKRPITEYYKESQHNSIPVISRFFSALVNWKCKEIDTSSTDTDVKGRTPAREMYKRYEQFHSAGNYKFLMTETSFGRQARKISGVTVKKGNSCNFYVFDYPVIKEYLQNNNEYDEDAAIH